MTITFTEYQNRAWETAIYNGRGSGDLEYVSLGLGGEAGEVQEYLKKTIWRSQAIPPGNLKKELGDVLWYVNGICSEVGWDVLEITKTNSMAEFQDRFTNLSRSNRPSVLGSELGLWVGRAQSSIVKRIEIGQHDYQFSNGLKMALRMILRTLSEICKHYSFTLEEVAETNLGKLSARQQEGTLAGEGDNR